MYFADIFSAIRIHHIAVNPVRSKLAEKIEIQVPYKIVEMRMRENCVEMRAYRTKAQTK